MADAEPDQPAEPVADEPAVTPAEDTTEDATEDSSSADGASSTEESSAEAIEEESAEESTSDTGAPGGTIPPWWAWVGRHRKPVALVVVLVVAVVVAVVVVPGGGPGPKDVVQSYMDAIRSGDTAAALEIAGEPEDDGRVRFLSADALAGDWSVEALAERHVGEDEADVDVTIRSGKTRQQGRFHMLKDENGWRMESPFVKVDLSVADLDVVELGRVRQPAERDETREIPLLLFPGAYDLYPSLADRIAFDQPRFIATPTEADDLATRLTAGYTLTDAGAEAAQKAVDAAIDRCAAQKVPGPPGCPFDVAENSAVYSLEDVSDVVWTVVSHPVAYFAQAPNGSGIELVVRVPGTVRVTGTGVPEDAARTSFALTCEFGLDNLIPAVTPDGVTIGNKTGDDYSAALSTECY